MSQLEEPSYDFFIAHAGADTSEAERLFDLLAQEVKVFLDSKSLMLGADWDRALAEAQRHSQVTVVLVSTRTDAAFYQREEIAAAIDLARKGEATHLVVPVYLDQSTDAVPYGLRLKHGVMVSDGLPIEKVAAKLIDLHRMLAPEATSVPERVAPQGPDQSRSLPQLLDQLFSRDPVLSLPAVVQLTKLGPEVIPDVVARLSGLNKVNIATVRTLLGRFPEESAPLMADRVLQAHRDWHAASVVPDCFTPNHQPFCADLLARHLTDDEPDVVRKCIESLGFMAAESFGYRLVELLDDFRHSDYFYGKYEYYVVLARARMLVLLESEGIVEQWQLPSAFSHVEKLIRESSRRGWVSLLYPHLQDVLAQCQARHADHLITSWLTSDLSDMRALAARSLGQMRLRRSLSYLVDIARDEDNEEKVIHEAAFAIANIGGPDAVDALEDLLSSMGDQDERSDLYRWALAHCVADAADDQQFDRLARAILARPPSEVCFVHRAIGLRRDDRFDPELRSGLASTETSVRGASSLALARLHGAKARDKILHSYREAAGAIERIQAALALLVTGEAPPDDAELVGLRDQLSKESYLYQRLVKDDILTVLTESGHPQASSIAEAWRGLYARGPQF